MSELRVAITFPHSLGAPGGGTGDCMQLALHMRRLGAEVTVVPVGSLGPTRFPRPKLAAAYSGAEQEQALEREGIEVRPVGRNPLHYLLDGRPVRREIERLLGERELDAVLGWWNETFFLPDLLARRGVVNAMNAAASYGPMFRGTGAAGLRSLRTSVFFTRPLRRADVVFARSAFTKRELVELGGVAEERIHVAHLGVEPVFATVPRDESRTEARNILFFGNLVAEKGIFEAIDALGRLRKWDWTFRVAGWGDADGVRRRAAEAGVAERIELVGRLDRPALLDALAWADLVVQPSHTESFGLANAESQAAGLPVIACRVAAVPEVVVDGETGWLTPVGDVAALAEAIEAALDDPEEARRRGRAGRARMAETFTWERTARVTLDGLTAARGR